MNTAQVISFIIPYTGPGSFGMPSSNSETVNTGSEVVTVVASSADPFGFKCFASC